MHRWRGFDSQEEDCTGRWKEKKEEEGGDAQAMDATVFGDMLFDDGGDPQPHSTAAAPGHLTYDVREERRGVTYGRGDSRRHATPFFTTCSRWCGV